MSSKRTKPEIDPARYQEILPFFKKEVMQDYKSLRNSIKEGRTQEAEKLIHKISGSSKTYGFFELTDQLDELKLNMQQENASKEVLIKLLFKIQNEIDQINSPSNTI